MKRMTDKKVTCPRCGGENVERHDRAYWYFCRDCGYNSMPDSDPDRALKNFLEDWKGGRDGADKA